MLSHRLDFLKFHFLCRPSNFEDLKLFWFVTSNTLIIYQQLLVNIKFKTYLILYAQTALLDSVRFSNRLLGISTNQNAAWWSNHAHDIKTSLICGMIDEVKSFN